MKKNKGFTLIELLAVIVILAIIALIATPMILGVIDSAKKSSAKTSAQYYVEAVEKSMMTEQMAGNTVSDGTYTTTDGKALTCKSDSSATCNSESFTVNYKGDAASGEVTISNGKVTNAKLTFSSIYAKEVTVNENGNATIAGE